MSKTLGIELRKIRKEAGETLAKTSDAIGIDRSHLTKIELGRDNPSPEKLNSLIAHFSLPRDKAVRLWALAGFSNPLVIVEEGRKEGGIMSDKAIVNQSIPETNVTIDPKDRPVLYSESVFIGSSEYGLVMDFAQRVGPSNQQFVVARIGMSFEHAKRMLHVLNDHLQKHER